MRRPDGVVDMTDGPVRVLIHLGSGEEGQARRERLDQIAEEAGAIGQRGAGLSSLLQMVADGDLEVTMATKYWMILDHYSVISDWVPCKARSLRGAKQEAWERYGGGFQDHRVLIAGPEKLDEHGDIVGERDIYARRKMTDTRWTNGP